MDSEVQQIKDRLAINEVVGQYVQLRRAGKNWSGRCPFHKERTPSFMVSPERGSFMCFGCGEKGDIFSFVQKMDGVDFPTALRQLAERAGVTLNPRGRTSGDIARTKERDELLREVCEEACVFFENNLKNKKDVQEYLHSRGVKEETIRAWRLGYAPASWEEVCRHLVSTNFTKEDIVDAGLAAKSERKAGEIYDRFRGRIMFPIFDMGGNVIAFSGRFFEKVPGSSEEEPAKYVNSPETVLFKKSRTLYGLHQAKSFIRKADCILLVEGQFDLVMAHQSGLPFTVALSGTALTAEHLSLLSRLSKRLVLALDADSAGLRAGLRSAHMAIHAGFDVKVPAFPEGKDPADVAHQNPELLKAAIRTSKTAIEFFLDAMRPGAKDERAYKKIVEERILPLLAALPSKIEQEHFIRIVSRAIGVSETAIRAEVAKRPKIPDGDWGATEEAAKTDAQEELSPLERAVGMLVSHFADGSAMRGRVEELFGKERLEILQKKLATQAERLRFEFEKEVGEHSDETAIAADLLRQVEVAVIEEEMASARGDLRRLGELAKRKQSLRV